MIIVHGMAIAHGMAIELLLVVRLLYMVRIVVLNIGSTGFQCGPHNYLRFLLVLSHLSISLLVVTYDLFLQVGRRQRPQLPPYML